MQTFLPSPNFAESAKCLARSRLGKQRVEAFQIYGMVMGRKSRWINHPAVKMWMGYPNALALYYNTMLSEFATRRRKNGTFCRNIKLKPIEITGEIIMPSWMGNEDFHSSHRSKLLFKKPSHYSQFGWSESPDKPYVWPNASVH